ncbi:MAG TPA: acyloxyacyl hydrolase [Tepidisphaeraceae bacterium]
MAARVVLGLLLVSCVTVPLRAQISEPLTAPSRPPAAFPKGTWDLEVGGSFAWEFYPYDHEKIAAGSVGVGYYLADNFAAALSVPVSHVRQPETHDATMVGLDLQLRYHFLQRDRVTLFADAIGGLAQADHPVPPGGTYFNFTLQLGLGATYRLADHAYFVGGLHFFHLSNAAIEGVDRNPDLNAVQPYLGVMFTF